MAKKNRTAVSKPKTSTRSARTKTAKSPQKPIAGKDTGKKAPKASAVRKPSPKTHLSGKELESFRAMLLEKRGQLLGDLSGMEAQSASQYSSGNLSSMPTHMADVGTDNFEHEFTLGLLESEQALLREIDEALGRIESRTYGICLGTGEPIPKARLEAKPWAKYTVEYTRLLEKGLVRPPGREEPPQEDSDEEEDDDEPSGDEEDVAVEADVYEDQEVDEE